METSYKEKYEKALEVAKGIHNFSSSPLEIKRMEEIFPELVESEDEKMMKEIIELVMQPTWKTEEEFHRRNVLCAWLENIPVIIDHEKREGFHLGYKACLERQGEQKPFDYENVNIPQRDLAPKSAMEAIKEEKVDNANKVEPKGYDSIDPQFFKPADSYCQENCKGYQETGKCFADGECKAKREAEQKPVIKFKTAEESLGISSDEYNKIVDECIFGEQKPEENKGNIGEISANWSEEDEHRLNSCLNILQPKTFVGNTETINTKWLKSLKGRVGCEANCTTTKEWSDDDRRKIDRIYSILRQAADIHAFSTSCRLIGDKECVELQDWLKSIKQRI